MPTSSQTAKGAAPKPFPQAGQAVFAAVDAAGTRGAPRAALLEALHPLGMDSNTEINLINAMDAHRILDAKDVRYLMAESGRLLRAMLAGEAAPAPVAPPPHWKPLFDLWRHGGWYVVNMRYPSGAVGCVSRQYEDRKWRVVCEVGRDLLGALVGRTFTSRDAAARAEWTIAMQEWFDTLRNPAPPASQGISSRLAPIPGIELPNDFFSAVQSVRRPYTVISEAEYALVVAMAREKDTDVLLLDGLTQVTFGTADSGYALMPLIETKAPPNQGS